MTRAATIRRTAKAWMRHLLPACLPLIIAPPVAAASATPYPGGTWQPAPAAYGTATDEDVAIRMDDGVVLRGKVTYPTDRATGKRAAGRFPVIVEHNPYDTDASPMRFFAERGYIYAAIRTRGTGRSGGEVQYAAPRDGLDGRRIIEWAARELDGSDGRLAMVGCSFPAWIALRDAAHAGRSSPVKAIVAACNGFHSQNRGTFMRAGLQTANMARLETLIGSLGDTVSSRRFFTELGQNIRSGGDAAYDGKFWAERPQMTLATPIAASGIPILLYSGWQDRVEGAMRSYVALQNAYAGRPVGAPMATSQRPTSRVQIIMGDWGHTEGLHLGLFLQWIETWLKSTPTGLERTAKPMHLFDPGLGQWVNVGVFPGATRSTRWYFGPSGTLDGRVPPTGSERLVWQDPSLPGGLVSFTSPPLAQGTTLSGGISATVYASSTTTNLMLVGRLFDVAPDGTETEISTGPLVGSMSELDRDLSWYDASGTVTWPWPRLDRDVYLKPGRVQRFDLSLLSRQWSIAPGHRVRLDIAGKSPAALCTAEALSGKARSRGMDPCFFTPQQARSLAGGTYTIMRGPRWPSALNLPQVRYGSFPAVPSGVLPVVAQRNSRPAVNYPLPLDWSK